MRMSKQNLHFQNIDVMDKNTLSYRLQRDEVLVKKDSQREMVKRSKLFHRIHDLRIAFGHVGRDKLVPELARLCFNVGYSLVGMYLAGCATCDERMKYPYM